MEKKTINPNLRIDHEILGYPNLISPFGGPHNSSPRATMEASHLNSYLVPINAEFPNIYSGYELKFGDYAFNTFKFDSNIEIIKVIPKYRKLSIDKNPQITVIYRNLDTGELDYANVYRYVRTSETYGFINSFDKVNLLKEGNIFEKGEELVYPANKNPETGEYKMGVNARVANMTLLDTYEDAFVISESLAKKLGAVQICQVQFEIDFDKYPLNIYGDEFEYKVFQDVGEQINEDGIVAAFRKIDKKFLITDLCLPKLNQVNFLHDKIYYGHPGAIILDIDVHMDSQLKLLKVAYDQFCKYANYKTEYYQDIFEVYMKYKNEKFSVKLNTLFSDTIRFLLAAGVKLPKIRAKTKNVKLHNKNSQIKLLTKITYAYPLEIGSGFKITGRDGAKGVICTVLPDNLMPENTDLIMDTASIIKRTNLSQLFEEFFTGASQQILKRLQEQQADANTYFNTFIEFFKDIDPEYAEIVYEAYYDKLDLFKQEIDTDGIKIFINPANRRVTIDLIEEIANKWNIVATPLKFFIKNEKGEWVPKVTKDPIFVGSKYIYLLYNLPKINAISIGIVNQYDVPTKSIKIKKFGITLTPTRIFGGDELRILIGSSFADEVARIMRLQGFSQHGLKQLAKDILTADQPSNIKRMNIDNKELRDSSTILHAVNTFYELVGVDIRHSKIYPNKNKEKE